MTLTKADLSNGIVEQFDVQNIQAQHLVDLLFKTLKASLEDGKEIRISGFGNFILRDKKSRPGRNPKTGEPSTIKARRVVIFHAGQKLKSIIEE